jgi:hypothetical protein
LALIVVLFATLGADSFGSAANDLSQWGQFGAVLRNKEVTVLNQKRFPYAGLLRHIRDRVPNDQTILLYRQAEMAYYLPGKRWIYDFDQRLIDFYAMTDEAEAHRFLLDNGVRYVLIPNSMPSTLYNSVAQRIFGNPTYSREIAIYGNGRLIALNDHPAEWNCAGEWAKGWTVYSGPKLAIDIESRTNGFFSPPEPDVFNTAKSKLQINRSWLASLGAGAELSGATSLTPAENRRAGIASESGTVALKWPSKNPLRHQTLATGLGPLQYPSNSGRPDDAQTAYVEFIARGQGEVVAKLYEYDESGLVKTRPVWDAVLTEGGGPRQVKLHLKLRNSTQNLRLVFTHAGQQEGHVLVSGKTACFVHTNVPPSPITAAAQANDESQDRFPARRDIATADASWNSVAAWNYSTSTDLDTLSVAQGSWCRVTKKLCTTIARSDSAFVYFAQQGLDQSGRAGLFINTRSTHTPILTNQPATGLRPFIERTASERLWRIRRNSGTLSFTNKWMAKFLEGTVLARDRQELATYELRLTASIKEQIVLTPVVYWHDAEGRPHADFLGRLGFQEGQDEALWRFKLPREAQQFAVELNVSDNDDAYESLHLRHIDIVRENGKAKAGTGAVP